MNEREDPIVAQIRQRREAHAQSFDFDLKRIIEDLRQKEHESGAQVVHRPPRKVQVLPERSSA
ncbi:MAG: hypothetical protein FJ265_01695 [Planctomycetes bacterium]|nr:hypothetical protein [Planctomycetota bacterium]